MLTLAIPVFNMAGFLPRCMDALLAQTCWDFEILLIDDGSTDGSAALCDTYAADHPDLVRAVHQKNGGLSAARNTGIAAARGQFIIFPDPDDWTEPDYVQQLLDLQGRFDADLVCTGHWVDTAHRSEPAGPDRDPLLFSGPEAQDALLLSPRMGGFAWNKLYRLEIIRGHGLRFLSDVGTTEDLDFTYRYLAHCNQVCYAPGTRTYHYFQRPGAATHSRFAPRQLDSIRTYEKIIADCAGGRPHLTSAAAEEICVTAVNLLWQYQNTKSRDAGIRSRLMKCIRKNLKSHLTSRRYGPVRKLQALTAAVSPWLFARLKNAAQKSE